MRMMRRMRSQPRVTKTRVRPMQTAPWNEKRKGFMTSGLSAKRARPRTSGMKETMRPWRRPWAVRVRTRRSMRRRARIVAEILSKMSVRLPPVLILSP